MSPRGLLLILAVATPILGNSLLKRTIHADGSRDFTIVKHIQKNTCSCSCKCVPDSVAEQWLSDRHEPVNKLVDDAPESSAVLEAILGPSAGSKPEKSPEAVAQNIEKTLSHLTPDDRKPEAAGAGAAQQRPAKNSVADFDATAPLAHRGGSRVQGVKNLNPVETTSSSSTVTPPTTPASSSNSDSDADWTDDQETKDSLASLNKEAANSEATDVTNVASSNSDKPNPTLKVTIHPAAEPTVTVRVIEESKSETTTAKLAENIDQHVEVTEQKNEDLPTTKPALPDTGTTVAATTKVEEKTEPEATPLATTTVGLTTSQQPQKDVETTQATTTTVKTVATTEVPEEEVRTTARVADLLTSSGMFRTSPRELPPRWKSLMDRLKIKLEELKARKLAEAEAKKQAELTAAKALVLGVEPTTVAPTTQQSTTTVSTSTVTQATTPKMVPATSEVAKTGDEAPSGLGRLILEDNSSQASGSKIVTVDPVATEATTTTVAPSTTEATKKPETAASTVAPGASNPTKKPEAAPTTVAPSAPESTKKPETVETRIPGASSSSDAPVTSTTKAAPKTQASEATTLTLGLPTNAPKDAQASESSGTTKIDLTTTKLDETTTPTTVGDSDLTTVLPSVAPKAGDVRHAAGATTPTDDLLMTDVTTAAASDTKEPETETTKKSDIPVTVATVTTTEKKSETSTNAPKDATTDAATTVASETSRATDAKTSAVPSIAKTSTTQAPTTPKTTVAQNNDATVATKNSETTTTTGSGLEIAFKTAPAEESTQNSKDAEGTTVNPIVVFPKKGKKAKEQENRKNKNQGLEIASVSEEDEPKEREVKKQSGKNQQKVKQQQQKKGKKNNKNDDEEYEVIPSEEDLDDEDEESEEEVKQKRPAFKTIHAHDDGNGDEKPRPEHVKTNKSAPKQKPVTTTENTAEENTTPQPAFFTLPNFNNNSGKNQPALESAKEVFAKQGIDWTPEEG
ncbi:unnamed protein product, partial [Mesorhabditis spiculigera]